LTVTQAQLQTVMKFTFGSATHRIITYRCASTLERTGVGHDVWRRFTYSIDTELEGSDLANLKTLIDAAKSELINSGSDFKIYRDAQIIHQHDANGCHFGPVARIDTQAGAGSLEAITLTVECLVPVSTVGGLIDETYEESTVVDDEGQTTSIVRSGTVLTTAAQSAAAWINANLPAQPVGYDRTLDIKTDDTDTSAAYTLTDAKTQRRNYDANVRDHKWSKTTTIKSGVLETIAWSGTVRMAPGQSARTYIEANLPATTGGYARDYSINNSDDDRDGTYRVTDTRVTWSGLPNIQDAQLEEGESTDANGRITLTRSGFFVGADAATQMASVLAVLALDGVVISRDVRTDIYGDGRISFRFTALATSDASGITSWSEAVRKSGGGRSRRVLLYPDRDPFIFNAETGPRVFEISGRAVSITGSYVAPPGVPIGLEDHQSGETEYATSRINDIELETAWRMLFICPPGTAIPQPRSKIVAFLP